MLVLAVACILLVQDDAARFKALADALNADDVVERDRAEAELLRIGGPAKRAIEAVAASGSAEAKPRALRLLAQIPLRDALGPAAGPDFARAAPGFARIDALGGSPTETEELVLDRPSGLLVADAILEGFAWRVLYDRNSGEHYDQLIALHRRVTGWRQCRPLAWVFVRLLEHESHYVRMIAVSGLGEIDAREHVDAVAAQMEAKTSEGSKEDTPLLRRQAAISTGRLGGEAHRTKLEALTRADDRVERMSGYSSLSLLGGQASIASFERGLGDSAPDIRAHCAHFLDRHEAKGALATLKRACDAERHGNVRPAMESAVRNLERLEGRRRRASLRTIHSGADSEIAKAETLRVTTPAEWEALWARHSKKPLPNVNFAHDMVIAVLAGEDGVPKGVSLHELDEDDAIVRLRYSVSSNVYQPGLRPYAFWVLARSAKPVVLEEDTAQYPHAPVWIERATLK